VTDALDHALGYAALGWRVIPIAPGFKYPKGWKDWQLAATTDPATITAWWTGQYAGWGVGIATGPETGIWVLDIDVADGKTGDETLQDLENTYHPLPDTVEAITGRGGRHLYFNYPPNMEVRAGAATRLGNGLDVRGIGGQVLAEPSIGPTGGTYTWVIGHAPGDIPVAEAPGWLIAHIEAPAPANTHSSPSDEGTKSVFSQPTGVDDGPADRYNAATTWPDLLEADGWSLHHTDRDGEQHWTRPGKERREGTSATVGYRGADVLKVFTSSVPTLEAERAYSRFAYYAATQHRGDQSAAAHALINDGYGRPETDLTWTPSISDIAADLANQQLPDTPTPLAQTARHGPPFPLHALPDWVAAQCTAVAESFQVPADLPATLALGALSTILAGHIKTRLTATAWIEHSNLYLVVALPPGTGKSPVFKVMTRAIVDLEKDTIRQRRRDVTEAEAKRDILEKQVKNAREVAVKSDTGTSHAIIEAARLAAELDELEIPPTGQMIGEDITPEALVETLATNHGRLALLSSEGGIFDMMAGQYAEKGRTANLNVYLQGWSADSIRRKRVKSEAQVIAEAILTICVTTQPGVVASLAQNTELVTRGLPVRFMFSLPPSNVGKRNRYRVLDDLDQNIRSTYDDTLGRIGRRWASVEHPTTIELAIDARDRFLAWDQACEHRLDIGGDMAAMAEWHSKLRSSVLRLAGILHEADEPPRGEPVTLATIDRALDIGEYWLEHARLVHDMWRQDPGIAKARTIVEWAIDTGTYEFTLRDIQIAKRGTFAIVDDVIDPLTILINGGWVTPHQPLPVQALGKGKPSQRFTMRPDASPQLDATDPTIVTAATETCGEVARVARVVSKECFYIPPYLSTTSMPETLIPHSPPYAQPALPAQVFHRLENGTTTDTEPDNTTDNPAPNSTFPHVTASDTADNTADTDDNIPTPGYVPTRTRQPHLGAAS
jgi:replicative DNA helicase